MMKPFSKETSFPIAPSYSDKFRCEDKKEGKIVPNTFLHIL
ncbi:hypothetical protein S101395_02664 [Bacillus sonorensis]|uniref:Uncharacterized protein n=1 Tax=Bacillus sonorensis TaxID=119858 RepID=A0ABN5AEM7_9BACI|nr:hypothetical protein S101395_02664 [Bacillus sonorensis]TWK84203.1 hypothetical protein CHCC20335_4271 [Bacillus paralicheniformis]